MKLTSALESIDLSTKKLSSEKENRLVPIPQFGHIGLPLVSPSRANFFFGPTFDLENFSHLVNLPFLFVLRKVTLLRGLVNLGDKTLESTQLAWAPGARSWGFFFSSDVAKSRSELYRQLVLLGEDFLCHLTTHEMTETDLPWAELAGSGGNEGYKNMK